MKKENILLLLIIVLIGFSTVVVFPEIQVATLFSRPLNWDIGHRVWQLPGLGEREMKISKGLDLQGGVQVVYSVDLNNIVSEDKEAAFEGVRAVMERRVNFFGVSEANVQTAHSGDERRVLIELPGINDIAQALAMIGQTAQLDFRTQAPEGTEATEPFVRTELTGAQLERASVQFDPYTGEPTVLLTFADEGRELFAQLTEANVGKQLAIYLDEYPLTAPVVQTAITDGKAVISGSFTPEEAKNLAIQLNSGALPAPVEIIEQRTIGAALGEESVKLSVVAGLVGLGLVVFFMWGYYGTLGFIAVLALGAYTLITLMLYKLIPVTLTLSGVAGFILSVGMAVDANILIFERYKEEKRAGIPKNHAVERAFGRAWDSIRDANTNTLIIAFILFNPFNWSILSTSGVVRGFALTLGLGVFLSLFTGVVIVRTLIRVFYMDPVQIIGGSKNV